MPSVFTLKEKIFAWHLLKTTTQEFKMPTSGRSKTFLLKLPDNSGIILYYHPGQVRAPR